MQTVLLLGGTGRTGGRVLEQFLDRGAHVRAIVRSAARLPEGVLGTPGLTVVEADLLSLPDEELQRYVEGCDAIVSCLGHTVSLRGVFGWPRDLVTRATARMCGAVHGVQPPTPVRLVLMSSVSVHRLGGVDARRGALKKAVLGIIRALVPPAKDNQRVADFLCDEVGSDDPFVEWVVVRPDTLREGDISEYTLHQGLVSSPFRPDNTNMANVAHFVGELVTDRALWSEWRGRLPVIVNAAPDLRDQFVGVGVAE